MPAWIAGIQVRRMRRDIHVGLDSSVPYWNDGFFLLRILVWVIPLTLNLQDA